MKSIALKPHEVRGILEGRQTQLRRVVKPQPDRVIDGEPYWFVGGWRAWRFTGCNDVLRCGGNPLPCPYGATGDWLWVKETFCHNPNGEPAYWYAADGIEPEACDAGGVARYRKDGRPSSPWTPSIHMPRWASRITLEIEAVRVEMLQDISEDDAKAEGAPEQRHPYGGSTTPNNYYRHGFRELWQSINGPGSWDANPFVWVITFKQVQNQT